VASKESQSEASQLLVFGICQAEAHKQRPQTLEKVQKIVQKVLRTSKTEAMNIA
jgi:hypothetical protein